MVTLENLKKLKIWVTYRVIDGRKIPFMPDGPAARADDPETWSSYADCLAADNKNGIGFELTPGFAVCDLDWKEDKTCIPFETIPAYAQALIDGQDTYTEFSPSGLGVHMIVLRPFDADPFTINNKSHSAGVEVYTQKHYFTLTERRVPGTREDFTGYDPTLFSVYMRDSARPAAAAGTLHVETTSGDICEGGRNETLHKIACGKRGDGLEYDEILAEMLLVNRSRCKPMLDLREVHNIVQSACKHPAGERKKKAEKPVVDPEKWREAFKSPAQISRDPLKFIVEGMIPEEGITILGGLAGHGKSLMALSIAKSICTGMPVFGVFPVPEAIPVLYLCPEAGDKSLGKRLRAFDMLSWHGGDFLSRTLSDGPALALDDPRLLRAIVGKFVILDTWARFSKVKDENNASELTAMNDMLFELIRLGCRGVLVLHHSPKSFRTENEMTLEGCLRGSGDIGAICSAAYGVRLLDKMTTRVHVENIKARDFEPGEPFQLTGRPYIDTDHNFMFEGSVGKLDTMLSARGKLKMPDRARLDAVAAWVLHKTARDKAATDAGVDSSTLSRWKSKFQKEADDRSMTLEAHLNSLLEEPPY